MERSREARRGVTLAVSNGLSRRRHRSGSLRESPDEDGPLELQETARLRDRKKDRDRDRDRDRERDRDRDRERDRMSRSSKRRRSDKFMLGTNRDDGDDSSEESVNDEEEDDEDEGGGGVGGNSSMRMLPPNQSTSSSSMVNHHHHHHHNHSNNHSNNNHHNNNNHNSRKSFPPQAKVFRAAPTVTTTATTASTWKPGDEMMGVSVPRKARSASTKRSHECWTSSGGGGVGGGEQIHRQASSSPVRTSVATVLATPAPASPSSSSFSVRKKMKPHGPKLRPPKSSSNKSPSSAQDEIEIEIAEVLYGMMRQPQGPSKQEIMGADSNSRENNNKSTSDSKSRVSSPISNSPSTLPQSSSILPTISTSSTAPMSAIAPKRKRPRPIKYEDENPSFTVRSIPISSSTKVEMDQSAKTETCSPHMEKNSGSGAAENGSVSCDMVNLQPSEQKLESVKPETNVLLADSKGLTEESESGGDVAVAKDGPESPTKESAASLRLGDDHRDNLTVTKANSTISEIDNQREEKFQIDLMAPPPLRSSPERDGEVDFVAVDVQTEMKPVVKEDERVVNIVKEDATVETEEKKVKSIEESESQKTVVGKDRRSIDLQLDLEKSDRDSGSGGLTGNKLQQHVQKQQQTLPSIPEKTSQSNSLPLPLPMTSWPGGLPPMGYMAPLQGVVSMDGSTVSSAGIQPPNLLFSQPRPKRCATHFYIARNIYCLQQITRMNPFWPAAAGSASLYGAKACNLNVVPPTELHGTVQGRGVNNLQDKGQGLAIFPGPTGKDSKGSQPATIMDAAQRKQVLLQPALPPGAPSNILQAPAFIFPLSQQQAAGATIRPGSVKSPPVVGNAASSSPSNSASVSATATAGAAAAAMGFNYPNVPGNDTQTQYLAILQNNAYPFPISAHVGAPPAYRGTHAQAMPFFNGSFYSSQMLHPSQIQQQQQPPLTTQSHQSQQGHQNTSISGGSSSSQKHLQNQHTRPHNSGVSGGSGTLQGFPAPKNQPPQQLQLQQRQQQQQQNPPVPHQARQLENETGGEESPSTADSRVTRANMGIYGQSFAMPLHSPSFALMTTAPMGGATSVSSNHGEKKPQQQLQQHGSKAGVEIPPQTFAMTFTSINGTAAAPGLDISSIAQNPAILQSLPEAMRQSYQIMANAQQKKNYRVSEEGKTGGSDTNMEEERKGVAGKPPATVGQSIAFSRPDLTDTPVSTMMGNSVIDSSTRTLNLGSAPARTSVSVMPASISNANASATQQQLQRSQQQQHQIFQLRAAAAARSKTPATSNGSVYSDHLPSSSMAAKFPNALSVFPQNLVQSNSSPAQSPQWKNSGRTSTGLVSSPSVAPSTTSSLKNLPQQQGRTQQSHTQISFATNPKSSAATQGQQPSSNNQSASPPMVVVSPTTSSISKASAGGSPRTTATTSTGNKSGSLSSQPAKNSPSMPSRKSSPVPSILGNPNITSSSGTGVKSQMPQQQQQQQQQQQLSKHAIQQAQLLFSNAYMQAQSQHVACTTSPVTAAGGFFTARNRDPQQLLGSAGTSSSGMLSLCPPVTHSSTSTSDPANAVTAATNMKGGALQSQGLIHAASFATAQASGKPHQLVPTGFPYVPTVPTPVQVKPAEQKQPAGE